MVVALLVGAGKVKVPGMLAGMGVVRRVAAFAVVEMAVVSPWLKPVPCQPPRLKSPPLVSATQVVVGEGVVALPHLMMPPLPPLLKLALHPRGAMICWMLLRLG